MISQAMQRTPYLLALLFVALARPAYGDAEPPAANETQAHQQLSSMGLLGSDDEPLLNFETPGLTSDDDETTEQEINDVDTKASSQTNEEDATPSPGERTIVDIVVSGNTSTSREAILNHIPFKIGELFDPHRTSQLIRTLYFGLNRFRDIRLTGQHTDDGGIVLHVIVEEKQPVKDVTFVGNKSLSDKEIKSKINFDIPAVDKEELHAFIGKIQKLYVEKGHQSVDITPEMTIEDDGKAIVTFKIDEGKKSAIRRILFEGNKQITEKALRKAIFSREEWILSMLDKAGLYQPERLEGDKYMIEQTYQNNGFLNAKVVRTRVDKETDGSHLHITFEIEEGERFYVSKVEAPGNDILPEHILMRFVPIRPGMAYSRERVTEAIKALERVWGDMGYIFAHIDPSIQPNEKEKTVEISFISDIGKKINLNKVTVKGNVKTRDKVIRRKLFLTEGEQVTTTQMEMSKQGVESLGYFEAKDGVNWKMRRVDEDLVDLDMVVHEAKTGHANVQLGLGGAGTDIRSPSTGFNVKGEVTDTNLFGSGIRMSCTGSWSRKEQTLAFHLSQPWLFDKPITGAMDIYHRRPTYEDLRNIEPSTVNEKLTGGMFSLGFITRSRRFSFANAQVGFTLGVDSLRYERRPRARIMQHSYEDHCTYQCLLDKYFNPGEFLWAGFSLSQDRRNHPMHPSRGLQWMFNMRAAVPLYGSSNRMTTCLGDNTEETRNYMRGIPLGDISFYSASFDLNWYTPLIGERDLVLRLHAFAGMTTPINNRTVPYRELFHIGGDKSVRGFFFGQIGPKLFGDSIGGKKAMFINAELYFPITPDLTIKGLVFYDGGAGFDTPYSHCIPCSVTDFTDNRFDYRHSVGFGVRLLNPVPVRIDWGFKIDPRRDKRRPELSESASEVHFGMNYDW